MTIPGRLILCRIGTPVAADIRLQITRSRKALAPGWVWVPQLAPPEELFRDYLRWRAAGQWPARWPEYRERFLAKMQGAVPQRYLERIRQRLAEGKSVALACFCKDERFCHRSLVAELVGRR